MGYGMYYFSNTIIGNSIFYYGIIQLCIFVWVIQFYGMYSMHLTLYFCMGYSILWYVFNAFNFVSLYGLLVCGLYKCIPLYSYVLIKAIL